MNEGPDGKEGIVYDVTIRFSRCLGNSQWSRLHTRFIEPNV